MLRGVWICVNSGFFCGWRVKVWFFPISKRSFACVSIVIFESFLNYFFLFIPEKLKLIEARLSFAGNWRCSFTRFVVFYRILYFFRWNWTLNWLLFFRKGSFELSMNLEFLRILEKYLFNLANEPASFWDNLKWFFEDIIELTLLWDSI